MTDEERFLEHVAKGPRCWIWTGSKTTSGYGRILIRRKAWRAHVLSHTLYVGPVPEGMVVCHRCDTPLCVRPDHLWLGTHTQNIADRQQKGRTARGERIRSTNKLSEEQAREMLALWRAEGERLRPGQRGGLSFSELGRRFGVSNVQARNLCLGLSWKHLHE